MTEAVGYGFKSLQLETYHVGIYFHSSSSSTFISILWRFHRMLLQNKTKINLRRSAPCLLTSLCRLLWGECHVHRPHFTDCPCGLGVMGSCKVYRPLFPGLLQKFQWKQHHDLYRRASLFADLVFAFSRLKNF